MYRPCSLPNGRQRGKARMNAQTQPKTEGPQDEIETALANIDTATAAHLLHIRASMEARAQASAEKWEALSGRLQKHIDEGQFKRWFKEVKPTFAPATDQSGPLLRLAFPTGFIRNWIDEHYGDLIRTFWQLMEPKGKVELVVEPAPSTEEKAATKPSAGTTPPVPAREPAEPTTAKLFLFPLPFGEDTRAVSNLLARCALFAAVKERQFFREYVTVGEVGGAKVEYKGEQLNQDDHDTLLQLVKMARHKPFGANVEQAVNPVLRGLGRKTRESHRSQLFRETSRLVSGTVRITLPNGLRYEGHLIDDAITPLDQATLPQYRRHLAYRLNPRLARFYAEDQTTLIDWKQRIKLKGRGSEVAKWLQFQIESHVEQFSMKVRTIHNRCGSTTKDLKHFRAILRQALALLKGAGIIAAWQIDPRPESEPYGDLVTIERTPSPSQLKHLTPKQEPAAPSSEKHLKPEAVEKFRAAWGRADPYACKADFDAWLKGKTPPRDYDNAFLGFAAKWAAGKF